MQTPPSPRLHRLGVALRDGVSRYLLRVKRSWYHPLQPAPPAPEPPQSWHWKLTNELAALPGFNEQVQAHLSAAVPPPDAAARSAVLLIFDELLTNVIKYAHPGERPGRRLIDVRLALATGDVVIEIEDDGVPFDPTVDSARSDAKDVPLEDRQIGGWGLSLVRRTADAMSYERAGDRNHVTLHKRFPVSPPTSA